MEFLYCITDAVLHHSTNHPIYYYKHTIIMLHRKWNSRAELMCGHYSKPHKSQIIPSLYYSGKVCAFQGAFIDVQYFTPNTSETLCWPDLDVRYYIWLPFIIFIPVTSEYEYKLICVCVTRVTVAMRE